MQKVKEKNTTIYSVIIKKWLFAGPAVLVFGLTVLYYLNMHHAFIDEIFASIQGEGPYVGQRHLFVRFIGCDLGCCYCDTPAAIDVSTGAEQQPCRAQVVPASFTRESLPNPVGQRLLSSLCARLALPGPARPVLSLTGGEPLLQTPFLRNWLPDVKSAYRIYLETNGIHSGHMRELYGLIDIVSMDIKLPSATGDAPRWDEHRTFLKAATTVETFVKVVVTGSTSLADLHRAVKIVADQDRRIPFIIQPSSGIAAPSAHTLIAMQDHALSTLEDVRVIPQVHMVLQVP